MQYGALSWIGLHKAALNAFCKDGLKPLPNEDLAPIFDVVSKDEWVFMWSKDEINWNVSSTIKSHMKLLGSLNKWFWLHMDKG